MRNTHQNTPKSKRKPTSQVSPSSLGDVVGSSTNARSTMTGKIWKRTCSRKVFIAAPLDRALRTSPVFLLMWKSREREWTCSNARVERAR